MFTRVISLGIISVSFLVGCQAPSPLSPATAQPWRTLFLTAGGKPPASVSSPGYGLSWPLISEATPERDRLQRKQQRRILIPKNLPSSARIGSAILFPENISLTYSETVKRIALPSPQRPREVVQDSRMPRALLSHVNLTPATSHGARLIRAYLPPANLQRINLAPATLDQAQLSKVRPLRAIVPSATLSPATISPARVPPARVQRAPVPILVQ